MTPTEKQMLALLARRRLWTYPRPTRATQLRILLRTKSRAKVTLPQLRLA